MNVNKSLNAKITLLVAAISIFVFSAVLVYSAVSQKALMTKKIIESADSESGLIYMSVEKPMVVGDSAATTEEFRGIKAKYANVDVYLTAYNGNITYSTDESVLRKDVGASLPVPQLAPLLKKGLSQDTQESLFVEANGKMLAARVVSILNAPKCHHCHGASEPILGEMVLLNDVSDDWAAMNGQIATSAVAGGLGLAILIGASMAAIRILLIRRFKIITAAAGRVREGDFKVSFAVRGTDELATLSGDLERMVGLLKNKLGFSEGVLNGIPVPCAIVGPDFRMAWINEHMCALLEKKARPETFLGELSGQFFWGQPERETLSNKAIKEKRRFAGEREMPLASGKVLFVNVTTTPFFDMDGNLLGSITFWIDVTDIRLKEQQIKTQHGMIVEAAARADEISAHLAKAAHELTAQIDEAKNGTQHQQVRITETSTAVEEMNATILEVAKNAGEAASNADNTRAQAVKGQEVTDESIQAIMAVRDRTTMMRESLHKLGEQAQDIGHVIDIITDIADQTNLLALNAAIEAARAGEAGRGFAVVADEVRKLAEKTMNATKEVNTAIRGIQEGARHNITLMDAAGKEVEDGAQMVKRAGEALKTIVTVSAETADRVSSIATAAEEQSAASEEITRSIEEINQVAQTTAVIMDESAEATNEVARMASSLQVVMDGMREP